MSEPWREHVADLVTRSVACGFEEPDEIVESVVECYEREADGEVLRELVEELVADAVAAHLVAQESWPDTTDCDRLDAALDELTGAGIVCRQHFSCCSTCGEAEIGAEMNEEAAGGLVVRGYAFYHQQDTESAAAGHGVYLKYGAVADGDGPLVAIGHEIADVLRQHGLSVEWNGLGNTAIWVHLAWQRRRADDGAAILPDNSW